MRGEGLERGTRWHRFWLFTMEFSLELRIGPDDPWIDWDWMLPTWPWRLYCWWKGHTWSHPGYPHMRFCKVCQRQIP